MSEQTVVREFILPKTWFPRHKELYNKPEILSELLSLSELIYESISTNTTLKESIDDQIKNLNSIVKSLRDTVTIREKELSSVKESYESQIKSNEERYKKSIETQLNVLLESRTKHLSETIEHKDRLITKLEGDLSKRLIETKESYETRLNDKQETISYHINRITNLENTIMTLRGELETLRTAKYKTEQNSSIKGSKGEQDCLNIMSHEFSKHFENGTLTIEKTNKEKGEGDIVMTMTLNKHGYHKEPITILIEAKNYNKEVPRDETEKFIRDTEFNSDRIDGAIFVSLNTRISNHPNLYFDTVGDKHIPIFLISKFNEEGMNSLFIPCILSMLSVSKSVKNLYDSDIERMRTELNRSLSNIIRQRNLITNAIKNLRKSIDELTESKDIASSLVSMIEEFHSSKRFITTFKDITLDSDKSISDTDKLIGWLSENTMKVDDVNEKITINEIGYILRNCSDSPCGLDLLTNDELLSVLVKDSDMKLSLYYGKNSEYGINGFLWINTEYKQLSYEVVKNKKSRVKS